MFIDLTVPFGFRSFINWLAKNFVMRRNEDCCLKEQH
jgi:hypothetical protein